MRERRTHPRLEHEFPVDIRLFDVPPTATTYKLPLVRGHTEDISMTGLRLVTPVEIPVGHRIYLRVTVDNPPSSYMHTALVRWIRPAQDQAYTAGLEFVYQSAASQQYWSELVKEVSRGATPPPPNTAG